MFYEVNSWILLTPKSLLFTQLRMAKDDDDLLQLMKAKKVKVSRLLSAVSFRYLYDYDSVVGGESTQTKRTS